MSISKGVVYHGINKVYGCINDKGLVKDDEKILTESLTDSPLVNGNYGSLKLEEENRMPLRPLNAYNIFFQLQRERILNNENNTNFEFTRDDVRRVIKERHDNWAGFQTAFENKPKLTPHKPQKRMKFSDLSRQIAQEWKGTNKKIKDMLGEFATQEREMYKIKMEAYKRKKQVSLVKNSNVPIGTPLSSAGAPQMLPNQGAYYSRASLNTYFEYHNFGLQNQSNSFPYNQIMIDYSRHRELVQIPMISTGAFMCSQNLYQRQIIRMPPPPIVKYNKWKTSQSQHAMKSKIKQMMMNIQKKSRSDQKHLSRLRRQSHVIPVACHHLSRLKGQKQVHWKDHVEPTVSLENSIAPDISLTVTDEELTQASTLFQF